MGLREEANKVIAQNELCKFGKILQSDDKVFAAEVLELFNDPQITNTLLSSLLKKHGHPVSDAVIHRHKRKVCCCVYS